MKKKSHVAITDPQQSLIIDIRELYLRSEENQEQTLGTPTKMHWLGAQQKQRSAW